MFQVVDTATWGLVGVARERIDSARGISGFGDSVLLFGRQIWDVSDGIGTSACALGCA